jgi:hypothetical protein
MRKFLLAASAITLLLVINACKKSSSTSNARTVQNFAGTYMITALSVNLNGIDFNVYDTLPACEKDNQIVLNGTSMAATFVDAGVKCVPPSDSTGTWSLSSNTDTLYVAGSASFIKSWDGSTLVLTNAEDLGGFPVTATTTLKKQ